MIPKKFPLCGSPILEELPLNGMPLSAKNKIMESNLSNIISLASTFFYERLLYQVEPEYQCPPSSAFLELATQYSIFVASTRLMVWEFII